MATVRVIVSGRVQGVGFRAACREAARSRSVSGWVRNTGDGRVEALLTGARRDVDAVLEWCRSGPPAARVDAVDVRPVDARTAPGGAVARRTAGDDDARQPDFEIR
ncbi:acylphosphatase [Georgenia sp. Z1344]|uniref:acylphosphatase n=1 Tax=Georgenia sp. Z1344 TaxID=3416706 RepID=UPI003CF3E50E